MKSFCKSVKQTKMYMFIPNPAPRKTNKESHPRMNAIMEVLFLSRYLLFPSSNSFLYGRRRVSYHLFFFYDDDDMMMVMMNDEALFSFFLSFFLSFCRLLLFASLF